MGIEEISNGQSLIKMRQELENRILRVVDEVDSGFRKVMVMYSLAFYLGLVTVIACFTCTIVLRENIFFLIFGGIGILDVIAFFIFKPAEDLQRSRGNLAQLVAAFLTWYNDAHNWNQYIAKMLKTAGEVDVQIYKEISKKSISNTITIMSAIEMFVASKLSLESSKKLRAIVKNIQEIIEAG